MKTESSDDISSGCPSNAEVPSGKEALRVNDFSNTVFTDDNLSSRREPTRENGEKVIQPFLPPEPLSDLDVYSDVGIMGSGSTSTCLASPSPVKPINKHDYNILLKTMTEHYNQFLKSATQLNDVHKQRDFKGGADASMRREITRLESKNTELSTVIRVLTEELAGVRQELANSKSCELQLQLSLDDIIYVLPDSWGY
ncbi:hypothetical protein MKX03_009171 [Papaver bracteatum]|nr:hypothetical protein MKX03_009171 [Papaver bracteatum]